MRLFLTLLLSTPLWAADEQQLALELKAQSQFERVFLSATPNLRDTNSCIQTQASLLPVAAPVEVAPTHFRKGYCTFAAAALTGRQSDYLEAAAEFDKAVESWPLRATKNQPAEPMAAALRILGPISRLHAGADPAALEREGKEIAAAEASGSCSSNVMPAGFCQMVLEKGREWLGTLALRRGDLDEAAKDFAGTTETGWPAWVAGRKAFAAGQYRQAATEYRQGVEVWRAAKGSTLSTRDSLSPRPDLGAALTDLGGALLLAGNSSSAISTLNEAVKEDTSSARPLYLRARAKEKSGDLEGALADYNLASRTAFAAAKDLASGEAHLYRGIAFYRRKDLAHAEDEFASALNNEVPADLRADATAWRHLAAVASGSCAASRQFLEQSLRSVSPYFPKDEARAALSACPAATAAAQPLNPMK